ncbi:YlbF family regulator [uncultured Chloroflexus sp.]|uniref:YlbF family regulator n=1 Tax=uncultured Chloroflexus sp. TaxID=214040 RepID=UPI0026272F6B|nr:YlbF family regulator [uncultured Chloroflexus sp.]
MDDLVFDHLEIAPVEVVKHAARDFATALAESPQFKVFEQMTERFRQDQSAQHVLQAYQEKQMAWRALIMLNALSPEQKAELERLHSAFVNHPTVQDYLKAQTDFVTLCQTLGDAISASIGLNYAAACGVNCCG